jgi:FKBP-type peptidyl-prolyl cis-trans isomerase 2
MQENRVPIKSRSRARRPIMIAEAGRPGRFVLKVIKIMIASAAAIPVLMSGAAAQDTSLLVKGTVIAPGDRADVRFTCRFKNDEVAISTDQDLAKDLSIRKSRIFLERDRNTPLTLFAGKNPAVPDMNRQGGFEGELFYQLSQSIVGMETGKKVSLEVTAERLSEEKKGEHYIKMARVRQRPKEVRLTSEAYKARTGKTPEVGQPYIIDPAVPGKVLTVAENEVVIRFLADPLSKVALPFGEGTIKEYADHYEIEIEARQGSLTRSGGLVGRIVGVDEQFITIDYGHPFGGEKLLCDVFIESPRPAQTSGMTIIPPKTGGT